MSMSGKLHDKWTILDTDQERVAAKARAERHSEITIPRLYTQTADSPTFNGEELIELYSSKMASLIVQRAGRLEGAIFPVNGVPFFNFSLNIPALTRLLEEGKTVLPLPPSAGAEGFDTEEYVRDILAQQENDILHKFQTSNYRDVLNMALQHVQVTGDPVLHMSDEYEFRLFSLAGVIIRKNRHGKLAEMLIRDWVATELLPDELKNLNGGKPLHERQNHEPYYRYMVLQEDGKTWKVESEFRGVPHGEPAEFKDLPYFHVGWNSVAGENYSRTPVEEHIGTIVSLEMCHKAMAETASASSQYNPAVDPTGLTRLEDIANKENGQVVSAREQDVWTMTVSMGQSLASIAAYIQQIEASLDRAWGASAATTLTGERVTATQINQASQEVGEADGPLLTQSTKSLQEMPVRRAIAIEKKYKRLNPTFQALWDSGAIDIEIKTGLDALGRQIDASRIQLVMQTLAGFQDPEFQEEFNKSELAREFIRTSGLDVTQMLRSQDEKKARAAAAQKNALEQAGAQQAIQTAGKVVENASR